MKRKYVRENKLYCLFLSQYIEEFWPQTYWVHYATQNVHLGGAVCFINHKT